MKTTIILDIDFDEIIAQVEEELKTLPDPDPSNFEDRTIVIEQANSTMLNMVHQMIKFTYLLTAMADHGNVKMQKDLFDEIMKNIKSIRHDIIKFRNEELKLN